MTMCVSGHTFLAQVKKSSIFAQSLRQMTPNRQKRFDGDPIFNNLFELMTYSNE